MLRRAGAAVNGKASATRSESRRQPPMASENSIVVLTGHYLPGCKGGGPIQSISNIVEFLGDEFEYRILTTDRDLGDSTAYEGVRYGVWRPLGKAHVMYLKPSLGGVIRLARLLCGRPSSVVYVNSVFNWRFSIVPAVLRWLGIVKPAGFLVAPRGEFSQGAIQMGWFRKRVYLGVAKRLGFYQDALWHATSEGEADDIRREIGGAPHVLTAPAISGIGPRQHGIATKEPGTLKVVFLSRVAPKKNLDLALHLLAGISGHIRFEIYGPIEEANYWRRCQELIRGLPSNIEVVYMGVVTHDRVGEVLSRQHLFLLPTRGENFGHVICEALVAGCPVLISDQTPWRGLEKLGVGWDLPLDRPALLREAIQRCVDMAPEDHAALRARARAFGLERSQGPDILAQNRDLFRQALERAHSKMAVNRPAGNLI
jgi:glycosyltransferase involved in cell wall biosynthesis